MKNGSGSRDASPLRAVPHLRAEDITVQCSNSSTVEAHEIVERGRTRNMVSKFEAGSKVNVCGSAPRAFANGHVENIQKVNNAMACMNKPWVELWGWAIGAGTWGAKWVTAKPGKKGGRCSPWKYLPC